jgi:leucyl aminopeptidase
MAITFSVSEPGDIPASAGAVGVPVFTGGRMPEGAGAEVDHKFLRACGFEGKPGQAMPLLGADGNAIVAVGVGKPAEVDADVLRRAGAAFARASGRARRGAVTLTAAAPRELAPGPASQAVVEGIALGSYRFTPYKSNGEQPGLRSVAVVGGDRDGVQRGRIAAEATVRARDWVNEPAGSMSPSRLAAVVAELAAESELEVEVWNEARIVEERLGALLGVAAGSAQPPRVIQVRYRPPEPVATVVLVGKGITFDSGGLSLKTAEGMATMKCDMGGAAAVLNAVLALAQLGGRVGATALVCATENMPSGTATRPGDVLRARNGKTIEVENTDAEGRLVLADGLSLATESKPTAIVDVATLTGAQKVALGSQVAALMANDDRLADQLLAAGRRAGEPHWRLPLWRGYRSHIDSDVADLRNIGRKGEAGTIIAGLFLQEFVDGVPWAHLDIAAPAFVEADDGWIVKGGTGWGVRTLLEFVQALDPSAA